MPNTPHFIYQGEGFGFVKGALCHFVAKSTFDMHLEQNVIRRAQSQKLTIQSDRMCITFLTRLFFSDNLELTCKKL